MRTKNLAAGRFAAHCHEPRRFGQSCRSRSPCLWNWPCVSTSVHRKRPPQTGGAENLMKFFLIPLFPHYAMSSYETAVARVREVAGVIAPKMKICRAAALWRCAGLHRGAVGQRGQSSGGGLRPFVVQFSRHSERHLRKSDPTGGHCLATPNCCETASPAHATCYRAQCFKTVAAFVARAGISGKPVFHFVPIRLGRDPWLKPYTDFELVELPRRGVKKLLVICPAFVSDCLETLEEIGLRGRETFLAAGGEAFAHIPV